MNEALASAMPVIMPDISPNNQVLPHNWLVPAEVTDFFMARTKVDICTTDASLLAEKIDSFANMNFEQLNKEKDIAYEIATREYSSEKLLSRYRSVMGLYRI